ncbi:MAG: hypothetical protein M3004_04710 [Bacteroidota bacterium]|nr:hypothetical protein [Bacteroidota bacterium]
MSFTIGDIVGSIGVFILLIAFVLNLLNKISKETFIYILMNIVGGALACFASYLINYWPFLILEAVWTLISLIALINYLKTK